jgi:hypothetical protein
MFQWLATDDDAKAIPVGEIGQAHAARLLDLWEDDVEVGTVQGFPMGDSPFQGSPERGSDALGMTPGQFVEEGDRAQAGRGRQKWYDLFVPQPVEWIGAGSPGPSLLFRAQWPGIKVDAPRGRGGQTSLGGSGHLRVVGAQSHVGPHLLVVDMSAWHRPLRSSEQTRPIRPTGEGNASV